MLTEKIAPSRRQLKIGCTSAGLRYRSKVLLRLASFISDSVNSLLMRSSFRFLLSRRFMTLLKILFGKLELDSYGGLIGSIDFLRDVIRAWVG